MPPEDRIRLLHMIEATETALNFVTGRQRADLDSYQMLLFALVRAIEIIGEAAGKVSEITRSDVDGIGWTGFG
jgi:uncharacterized protein with HEPN domain